MTSDAELDSLDALANAATPGPWRSMREGNQYVGISAFEPKLVAASRVDGIRRPSNPYSAAHFGSDTKEPEVARFIDADADFIAAARTAVPALCAEVRRLRDQIEQDKEQELDTA